jgi:hypothetical protein
VGTRTSGEKAPQQDVIHLDYEQAHEMIRMLSDVRFKLLTLVPFVSGATITFFSLDPADAPQRWYWRAASRVSWSQSAYFSMIIETLKSSR